MNGLKLKILRLLAFCAFSGCVYSGYARAQEDIAELEVDFVFADFQLDNRKTGVELDLATLDYKNYFLSISLFNREFAANLSCEQNQILAGRFWEGNIELPLSKQDNEFFIEDEECYINASILERLDIRYRFDEHRQIFSVLTNGRHPKTKELKKAARKQMLEKLHEKKQSSLEITDNYQLATPPAMDINSSYRWQQNTHSPSLFSQAAFDLLYHQADAQINWQKQGRITGRAKLSRKIPWGGNRLHYQMGDIQESRQSLFDIPSRGLGLSLGPRTSSGQRNSMDLNGYTQPNSEVELYKDDLLIDFIRLDDDGFYEFKNVDFHDQSTEYKIVINSPDGVESIIDISRPGEHGLLPGEWSPSFVILDSGQSVFSNGNGYSSGKLIAAEANYALSSTELLSIGLEHKQEEEARSLLHAAVSGVEIFNLKTDFKVGYLDDLLYGFNLGTVFGKHSLSFSTNQLSNGEMLLKSNSVNWAAAWNNLTASMSASKSQQKANKTISYDADLGYRSQYWSISLKGQYNVLDSPDTTSGVTKKRNSSYSIVTSRTGDFGNINLSYRYASGLFAQQQQSISANYSHHIEGVNSSLSFRWDLEQNRKSTSVRLSKSFEHFKVNGNAGYSDTAGWSIGLGIAFGLFTQEPFSSLSSQSVKKGSYLSLKPFLDLNQNDKWDDNEEFLSQVNLIQKNKTFKKSITNNSVKLFGIDAYNPKIYSIDDEELNNPFITPKYRDIKLESHPGGEVELNIPFHIHYEIEGEIQLLDKDNNPIERVGQLPLKLYKYNDDIETGQLELSRTYWSEPDGFYVLDKVKPGKYKLEVDNAFITEQEITCITCEFILNTEEAKDYVLFANTFMLKKQKT